MTCPECSHPFTPMQIERIMRGKSVICERCGYEYKAITQDFRDIMPAKGIESQNLYRPRDLLGSKKSSITRNPPINKPPFTIPNRPAIQINDSHPRINKKKIIKELRFNEWITLNQLGKRIGVLNEREFYILRMKLNEMNREGLIQMDFQVNRVLIRKIRSHV